jgi:hypothetical protein
MSNTDHEVEAKLAELKELKNKIGKLDEIFERNLKAVGLTEDDLRKIDLSDMPPDVKKIVDETKLAVRMAGEQVARDLSFQNPKSSRRSFSRSGALKL